MKVWQSVVWQLKESVLHRMQAFTPQAGSRAQVMLTVRLFRNVVHRPSSCLRIMTTVCRASSGSSLRDGTVYCVGRNYLEHIKELPGLLDLPPDVPTVPMVFLKSPATISRSGSSILLPSWSQDVHHELELAIQLGQDLQPCAAAVSIDLTARDVQAQLKKSGHPWALSKSFKGSLPLGSLFSLEGIDVQNLDLNLEVNGKTRQKSNTSLMIFKVSELVTYLDQHFPLQPGDWILTGTPEGVASIHDGDTVRAGVAWQGNVLSEGTWSVSAT